MNKEKSSTLNNKKILILANCILSNSTANGRTLKNFLKNFHKENIAQFCINCNDPDYSVCNNYYQISDYIALKSFILGNKKTNYIIKENNLKLNKSLNINVEEKNNHNKNKKKIGRTNVLNMLLREMVWSSKRWCSQDFYDWIEEFKPDLILIQCGDFPFMINFATELSIKYDIPLISYNSEEYYFKEKSFFYVNKFFNFLYPILRNKIVKAYDNMFERLSGGIYITEYLMNAYKKVKDHNATYIMTSASKENIEEIQYNNKKDVISYTGGLNLNRYKSLIDIANVVYELNPKIKFNIYAPEPSNDILEEMNKCKNINYCGFVSYTQVNQIMNESLLLIHAEDFSDFTIETIKYGFSTKIADSLASGTPLFVYEPRELTLMDYLKDNNCAFIASSNIELKENLNIALNDVKIRQQIVKNAINIAKKNHDINNNAKKFDDFIDDCCKIKK